MFPIPYSTDFFNFYFNGFCIEVFPEKPAAFRFRLPGIFFNLNDDEKKLYTAAIIKTC